MRLIDADALKNMIPDTRAGIFENCRNCALLTAEDVMQLIDRAPPSTNGSAKMASRRKAGNAI